MVWRNRDAEPSWVICFANGTLAIGQVGVADCNLFILECAVLQLLRS